MSGFQNEFNASLGNLRRLWLKMKVRRGLSVVQHRALASICEDPGSISIKEVGVTQPSLGV